MVFDWNDAITKGDFSKKVAELIEQFSLQLSTSDRLKLLLDLEARLYEQTGRAAIAYGNGVHTKHRHINYHQFFIDRIPMHSKVLDIGCGNGALTQDIACKVTDVAIVGIDLNPHNIDYARKQFAHPSVQYICGDVLKDLPRAQFDYIVMSNVLEHLPERVGFLKQLVTLYNPSSILVRVPVFERDWRVPLKEELGIDYRLDATHYIEYKKGQFEQELAESGLVIKEKLVNWGEIWAECAPGS